MMPDATGASAFDQLARARIVPVVVIDDAAAAGDLVDALLAGGLKCAEFTLRTNAALASITAVAGRDDFLLGAGTVLSVRDVDASVDAGAKFVVSPGFDEAIVRRAQERGVLALPGIATATELQAARRAGLHAVKFFPADRLGGLATISAFAAPFPDMKFMPSGGVDQLNAAHYLSHPSVFAVGGSWMAPRATIAARDVATLTRLGAQASSVLA